MTDQELSESLAEHQELPEPTLRGIDKLNKGYLEEALLAFEESLEIYANSIPTLLYHSLCCFLLIQPNLEGIRHPKSREHIQDMISSLDTASDVMKFIKARLQFSIEKNAQN